MKTKNDTQKAIRRSARAPRPSARSRGWALNWFIPQATAHTEAPAERAAAPAKAAWSSFPEPRGWAMQWDADAIAVDKPRRDDK